MIHKLSEKMPQRVHKCSADDPRIHVRKNTRGESHISENFWGKKKGHNKAEIICGRAVELLQ
jgi:hypothetical protein